jgi:hypothetical protein
MRDVKNDALLDTENENSKKRALGLEERNRRVQEASARASRIESKNYADANDFAAKMGIPFATLALILKDHHERDHLVRESLHE